MGLEEKITALYAGDKQCTYGPKVRNGLATLINCKTRRYAASSASCRGIGNVLNPHDFCLSALYFKKNRRGPWNTKSP